MVSYDIFRDDVIRSVVGPVPIQKPGYVHASMGLEHFKRFGVNLPNILPGEPIEIQPENDASNSTNSTVPSSAGANSNASIDSTTNLTMPQVDVEYVANLMDYTHVVAILEQPVSNRKES